MSVKYRKMIGRLLKIPGVSVMLAGLLVGQVGCAAKLPPVALPPGIIAAAGWRAGATNELTPCYSFCDGAFWTSLAVTSTNILEMEFSPAVKVGWLDVWLAQLPLTVQPEVEYCVDQTWRSGKIENLQRFAGARVLRLKLEPATCRGVRLKLAGFDDKLNVLEMIPYSQSPFQLCGKVMIESGVENRLLPGAIRNCFSIEDLPNAREPATAETREGLKIGNGFLSVQAQGTGAVTLAFVDKLNEKTYSLKANDRVKIIMRGEDQKDLWEEWKVSLGSADSGNKAARFSLLLEGKWLQGEVQFTIAQGEHFVRLAPKFKGKPEGAGLLIHSVGMGGAGGASFFIGELPLYGWPTYNPGITLKAGETWEAASAVWGVYGKRGDWVREYYRLVSPVRQWCSARYSGWASAPKNVTRELADRIGRTGVRGFGEANFLAGVGYPVKDYGVLDGKPDWEKLVQVLKESKLPIGIWCGLDGLSSCFLVPEREAWIQHIEQLVKKYDVTFLDFDFYYGTAPCKAKDHLHPYHPEGLYSMYQNNRALLEMFREFRRLQPGIVLTGHVGLGMDNQIIRELDVAHTGKDWRPEHHNGGFIPELQEERRNTIWSFSYGLGCILQSRPNYRMWTTVGRYGTLPAGYDRAAWEDGLAVAAMFSPNIGVYGIPEDASTEDLDRIRRWLEWSKAHQDLLRWPEPLFLEGYPKDVIEPWDVDTCEGIRQIRNGQGFILLYNPTSRKRAALLNFQMSNPVHLQERYPEDKALGKYAPAAQLTVTLAPKSVRLLEVSKTPLPPGNLALRPDGQTQYLAEWSPAQTTNGMVALTADFSLAEAALTGERPFYTQFYLRNFCDVAPAAWSNLTVSVNGQEVSLTKNIQGRNVEAPRNEIKSCPSYPYPLPCPNPLAYPCVVVIPRNVLNQGKNTMTVFLPDQEGTVFYGGFLGKCWWR